MEGLKLNGEEITFIGEALNLLKYQNVISDIYVLGEVENFFIY